MALNIATIVMVTNVIVKIAAIRTADTVIMVVAMIMTDPATRTNRTFAVRIALNMAMVAPAQTRLIRAMAEVVKVAAAVAPGLTAVVTVKASWV